MSFTGDLEHLPIVDVIQLLHSTRKTGTLCVRGERGECQLVFDEGYITSANHSNTSVRIGKILVDMGVISQTDCDTALAAQKAAGGARKPLIAALIEQGKLDKDNAYRGLRNLIEMTVVEMLRWPRGTFTLDVNVAVISDEYRYFPEILHQEINLDTQRVLMDALRIFDEKTRDGEFTDEDWNEPETPAAGTSAAEADSAAAIELSADDLGLGDIEQLERKIPEVFSSIEMIDPAETHRRAVADFLPEMAAEEREKLVEFLLGLAETAESDVGPGQSLIFFSRDQLARYMVMNFGKTLGVPVFTSDEGQALEMILNQALRKKIVPLLIFDSPNEDQPDWSPAALLRLRREFKGTYEPGAVLQLVETDQAEFSLESYREGVRAVMPRPAGGTPEETLRFYKVLLTYCRDYFAGRRSEFPAEFKAALLALQGIRDAAGVSQSLLANMANFLERALTLVVRPGELIAERGIGLGQDKSQGAETVEHFTIPMDGTGLLSRVLESGRPYFGPCDDKNLREQLFPKIGAPRSSTVLLLPMPSHGRIIAILYGDFGADAPAAVPVDFLEVLVGQAGLVLENAVYRRRLEKVTGKE